MQDLSIFHHSLGQLVSLPNAEGTSSGNNVPMTALSLQADLSMQLVSLPPRPNFDNIVTMFCKNEGTQPVSGQVTLVFDMQQNHVSHAPAGVLDGNAITWDLPRTTAG